MTSKLAHAGFARAGASNTAQSLPLLALAVLNTTVVISYNFER